VCELLASALGRPTGSVGGSVSSQSDASWDAGNVATVYTAAFTHANFDRVLVKIA